jgi:hypothetical protein
MKSEASQVAAQLRKQKLGHFNPGLPISPKKHEARNMVRAEWRHEGQVLLLAEETPPGVS